MQPSDEGGKEEIFVCQYVKIDYTDHLADKPLEKDPAKIKAMELTAAYALAERGIFYGLDFACYADGCVRISSYGTYRKNYTIFDTKTGEFLPGG